MSKLTYEQQLAVDAWQLIYNNPELHEQGTWRSEQEAETRCGTKLCWGGHVVVLDGGVFLTNNKNSSLYQKVLARPTDYPHNVANIPIGYDNDTLPVVSISGRIQSIFRGVSDLSRMTGGELTVERIRQGIIKQLRVDPKTGLKVEKPASTCYCGDITCHF